MAMVIVIDGNDGDHEAFSDSADDDGDGDDDDTFGDYKLDMNDGHWTMVVIIKKMLTMMSIPLNTSLMITVLIVMTKILMTTMMMIMRI